MSHEQLRKELDRAARAREIIEHPLWIEAWGELRERCLATWENGTTPEIREEAWRTLTVAKKVRRSFEVLIETGKMAEIALEKTDG